MKDLFSVLPGIFRNGIILNSEYEEGRCGTITVYLYQEMHLVKYAEEMICKIVEGALVYEGAQEPADWDEYQRLTPLWERKGKGINIPRGLGSFDRIPTSNGSYFLSLKELYQASDTVEVLDFQGSAFIFENEAELDIYLNIILPQIGVPVLDIQVVKSAILTKLKKGGEINAY